MMDKALASAVMTGAAASTLAAIVSGLFKRSENKLDSSLTDRTLMQQEREYLAKEAKTIRDELKAERDELRGEVAALQTKLEDLETNYSRRVTDLIEATSYWMHYAIKRKTLDDFPNYPILEDLRIIYASVSSGRVEQKDE